jgi:hypothetical protein
MLVVEDIRDMAALHRLLAHMHQDIITPAVNA